MKKFTLLSVLLVFFSIQIFAQVKPFAEKNARWYYQYLYGEPSWTELYVCLGDTVINSTHCSLIRAGKDSTSITFQKIPVQKFCMYRDSNAVYAYDDSTKQFAKVFDFNLKVNDSFKVVYNRIPYKLTVYSTANVTINKIAAISWNLEVTAGNQNGPGTTFNNYFGGNLCPLPLFLTKTNMHSTPQGLNCYEDSTLGHYMVPGKTACEYSAGGINTAKSVPVHVEIYPNPAHNQVMVRISNLTIGANVTLSDICGKSVMEKKLQPGETETMLDISKIPPGLYFISVNCNGMISSSKLVMN